MNKKGVEMFSNSFQQSHTRAIIEGLVKFWFSVDILTEFELWADGHISLDEIFLHMFVK